MATQDSWVPAAITMAVAAVLAVWAAYAFSGAGLLTRLPLVLVVLALEAALRLLGEGKARRWARGAWIVLAGYTALVSVMHANNEMGLDRGDGMQGPSDAPYSS